MHLKQYDRVLLVEKKTSRALNSVIMNILSLKLGTVQGGGGNVGYHSHLGGALVGAAAFFVWRSRLW
jgi:membrane associated rhomboid family serine protease